MLGNNLLLESRVAAVAPGNQECNQVKDFLFRHSTEQPLGHGRCLGDRDLINLVSINPDLLIRVGQIRVKHQLVSIEINNDTGVNTPVVGNNDDGRKLFINDLAWIDDLIEQIMGQRMFGLTLGGLDKSMRSLSR